MDDTLWTKPPLNSFFSAEEYSTNDIAHYGMPRRSGRYPYGSGKDPHQHGSGDFISRVEELRKQNFTFTDNNGKKYTGDTAIAKSMGISTSQFRVQYSMAKNERRGLIVDRIKSLKADGMSNVKIAEKLGLKNESTVRSLLNERSEARMKTAENTANFLKKQIDEKGIIDVGKSVELELGISRNKLDEACYMLELQGYKKFSGSVPQINRKGQQTNLQVIGPPDMEHKDLYDYKNINSITDYISHDGGDTFSKGFVYPKSMDSKRLAIRYAEDGGLEKDGVIEIRRGCKDLDLGKSNYAQVRILVDNKKYLKGMAIYSDDLPDGVDVMFNTNKSKKVPKLDVLKDIKKDPNNPFGSLIKEHGGQSFYVDENGKKQLSLINKRAEEGDWSEWSDKLPSQFLAKQNVSLIKRQLNLTADERVAEYKEICALTNPTVKKQLLKDFADNCDASAVHLKSASLPRQRYKVILPIPELKDDEVYAPTYENGEKLALVRYPHGGTFEIPIVTVNNKHVKAKKILGNAIDAIGINSKVAERLSGADFDGDTVTCIPTAGNGKNLGVKITSTKQLEGLKGFDPKLEYGGKPIGTFKQMRNTQNEMGKISNLITDMTLKGATTDELARAVRHSMVVIDAEKHKLDYMQSYQDNAIASLKKKYQGHVDANGKYHEGASTLMSSAKGKVQVLKRKGSPIINPETGEKTYKTVEEEYIDKRTGKKKLRMQDSTKMAETKDAHTLSSGTVKEELYADYANKLKALANTARKEMMATGKIEYDKEAKKKYEKEVASLTSKLNVAKKNAPKERRAQIIANAALKERRKQYADSDLSDAELKKELKKVGQQELLKARTLVGAKKEPVKIEPKEWEAIQSGAISESKLKDILLNADMDVVRQLATPKSRNTVSKSTVNRIQAYKNNGYTIAEIAKALGISTSTVSMYMKN